MDTTASEGLIEHFLKLKDLRVDRNKKYEFGVTALCAMAGSAESAEARANGGQRREEAHPGGIERRLRR